MEYFKEIFLGTNAIVVLLSIFFAVDFYLIVRRGHLHIDPLMKTSLFCILCIRPLVIILTFSQLFDVEGWI